jgi:hypothetical protein
MLQRITTSSNHSRHLFTGYSSRLGHLDNIPSMSPEFTKQQ